MKQKIEWYKEVLELEPGSRVFFPLAKLLAADGQTADAVHVLRQGLLRHPDHVEARLLLVELFFLQDAGGDLRAKIDQLGVLFAAYPGFWKAWSEQLAATPALRDAALAMRFFAAALQGKKISWGEIIEHGLHSLLGSDSGAASFSPAFTAHRPSAQEEAAMRRSVLPIGQEDAAPQGKNIPVTPETTETPVRPAVSLVDDSARPVLEAAETSFEPEQDEGMEDEEADEAFSIRTRSMAEVLAEQGDIAGALDIYHELMQTAEPDEKNSLMARADELATRMTAGPAVDVGRTEEKNKAAGGESTRLVSLLESLAQRLEARAR